MGKDDGNEIKDKKEKQNVVISMINEENINIKPSARDMINDDDSFTDSTDNDDVKLEEYSVMFTQKPFGLVFGKNKKDKKNLFVTGIEEDGAGDKANVIIGSKVLKLQDESVEDLGVKQIYKIM